MKVNLEDVLEAIDFTSDEISHYYYIPQERIIMRNEFEGWVDPDLPDEVEPEDLIPLPTRREIDDYGNMLSFIEQKTDGDAREWLSNAVHGRGAFRMFRAACERFGLIQDWYDFRDRCHRATAILWCEENGIVYTDQKKPREDDEDLDFAEDLFEDEPEVPETVTASPRLELRLVEVTERNYMNLVFLKAEYDVFLKKLKDVKADTDPDEAQDRLEEALERGWRIIAASDHGRYLGYIILDEGSEEICVRELFVRPESRRKGIATALMEKAEAVAEEEHCDGVVSHVQPENTSMFAFLRSIGYTSLISVEIRRSKEKGQKSIQIGSERFDL